VFKLGLLISNNFPFCFSNSGWAVGPSGGIVYPDLVTRMRLDESSEGHFSYGPSLGLFREPFFNERYLFSDSQFHTCGPYLEMERKFFSDNAAIVREVYFDADLLLGVDPEEDLAVEEAVNYEDLVPVLPAEEIAWQHAAANDILNMEIVRVTPVNSDSEDEETMERVTSPVVVEAVGELVDAGEAAGFADIGVNNAPELVIAAEGDYVEETVGEGDYVGEAVEGGDYVGEAVEGGDYVGEAVEEGDYVGEAVEGGDYVGEVVEEGDYVGEAVEGWAEAPSDPGPFSEDVSMDDFLPSPRRGSVPFLTFSDAAGDEVILYFPFCYPMEHFAIKFWRLICI
jgi:hypothetical protein